MYGARRVLGGEAVGRSTSFNSFGQLWCSRKLSILELLIARLKVWECHMHRTSGTIGMTEP